MTPASSPRDAGKEQLSLALIDARNHTLQRVAQFEKLATEGEPGAGTKAALAALPSVQALLGHIGWFQEWWIARHVQRHLGPQADAQGLRLASIEPYADTWWETPPKAPGLFAGPQPDLQRIKAYLLETLETTLELLDKAAPTDAGLHFFRLALLHEDLRCEDIVVAAQTHGVKLHIALPGAVALREPLQVPAMQWRAGSEAGTGFAFDNEQPAFDDPVPEFEIDAQAVSWSQFVEFVDDGGYDREELWHPEGWKWLQQKAAVEGRRGPRYVDQIGVASGAVMQTRFGTARRMSGGQCVTHVTWYEADAWARWAGRRLPTEIEWEVAAHVAQRRGFRLGDVWEWTASTFRPYPGFVPSPWAAYSMPHFGVDKVQRGWSFATPMRLQSLKFRKFAAPDSDADFCGFRSCAI